MKQIRYAIIVSMIMGIFVRDLRATDLFYRDISAESPSKRYKIEAKSPDNEGNKKYRAFQASFIYTCRDSTTKQVMWTRAQAMGKTQSLGPDLTETISFPKEASPVNLFVSDAGWTVIWTGGDELLAVDLAGHDRCLIPLLTEGFTEEEKAKYLHYTTAGPFWSGYSLWYFLDVDELQLFVIRPWWGRRIVLNLKTEKLVDETQEIEVRAFAYERNFVMTELAKGVETRRQGESEDRGSAIWPILNASYLAGRLPVPEAAPLLERLQDDAYMGSSTMGGLGSGERFDGEVNPHSYKTLTLRRVVQLSLRRLGKTPGQFPANRFDVKYEEYGKSKPYVPKPLSVPRESNAAMVEAGMKAEQVLDLLRGPDFVGYDTWEYDMDATPPFSLILKWNARQVIGIQKRTPVLWKDGFVRDEQVVK